jgi:hypothetical protein
MSESMTKYKQQAMDGSPARVSITLHELWKTGKFKGQLPDRLSDEVIGITFQCGPLHEVGVNGCSIEDVIDVLVTRLEGFQRGPFACSENRDALVALSYAKAALLSRTVKRQTQGVEGTNAPHVSP